MDNEEKNIEGQELDKDERIVENLVNEDTLTETKRRIRTIKRVDILMIALIAGLIVIILLLRGCQVGGIIHGTVDIPDNIIDLVPPNIQPVVATSIKLNTKDEYDNIPFNVDNMLPGDRVSQYYCVSVTHDSKGIVRFSVLVDGFQELSNVLRLKVEQLIPDDVDVVLYEGLIKDCSAVDIEILANEEKISEIYYRITVYSIGSEVGNEYVGASLEVDFSWQIM